MRSPTNNPPKTCLAGRVTKGELHGNQFRHSDRAPAARRHFRICGRLPGLATRSPSFGALVKAPAGQGYEIFGLIHDIHIDDDGLVRQLVTADGVDESIITDNRLNRNVPLEMSVLSVGYRQDGRIYHLLPPRPPLSLDVIYRCSPGELREFTSAGRFGYFRHVLRASDLPVGELLAAHVQQAQARPPDRGSTGLGRPGDAGVDHPAARRLPYSDERARRPGRSGYRRTNRMQNDTRNRDRLYRRRRAEREPARSPDRPGSPGAGRRLCGHRER